MSKTGTMIEKLVEAGCAQITILEGDAPEQLNLKPVCINGNFDAPRRFVQTRKHWFGPCENSVIPSGSLKHFSNAIINKNDGTIVLLIDECNPHNNYTITGAIKIGKKFQELGINKAGTFSSEMLSQKLRMLRSIFLDKDAHANVVTSLRNIRAKIEKEIEKDDDQRGNKSLVFKQKVESNIPISFALKMPIIEGLPDVQFDCAVILSVNESGGIVCQLESIDAQEFLDLKLAELMDTEAEFLKDFVTVIFI